MNRKIALIAVICAIVAISALFILSNFTSPPKPTDDVSYILDNISISETYGEILKKVPISGSERVVIYIQDQHCTPKLQENIINAVEELTEDLGAYNLSFIAVEGMSGYIDVSYFTDLPEPPGIEGVKEGIAKSLLSEGKISGIEYLMLINEGKWVFYGVEDKQLYNRHREITLNLDVLRQQAYENFYELIRKLEEELDEDEKWELEGKIEEYLELDLSFEEIYDYVKRLSMKKHVGSSEIAFIDKYFEENETFNKISEDRGRVHAERAVSEMENRGEKICVLVSGGGHTHEIEEVLNEKRVSYIVFAPKGGDYENYYEIMYKESTPFEKELEELFGSIPPPPWTCKVSSPIKAELWVKSIYAYKKVEEGFDGGEIKNRIDEIFSGWNKVEITSIRGKIGEIYIDFKVKDRGYITRISINPITISTDRIIEKGKIMDNIYYEVFKPEDSKLLPDYRYSVDRKVKEEIDKIAEKEIPFTIDPYNPNRLLIPQLEEDSVEERAYEYVEAFEKYPEIGKDKRIVWFIMPEPSKLRITTVEMDEKGEPQIKHSDISISPKLEESFKKWNKILTEPYPEEEEYRIFSNYEYFRELLPFIKRIDEAVGEEKTIIFDIREFRECHDILCKLYSDRAVFASEGSSPIAIFESIDLAKRMKFSTSDIIIIYSPSPDPKYTDEDRENKKKEWEAFSEEIEARFEVCYGPEEFFELINKLIQEGKPIICLRVGDTDHKTGEIVMMEGRFGPKEWKEKFEPDLYWMFNFNCLGYRFKYDKVPPNIGVLTSRAVIDEDIQEYIRTFANRLSKNGGDLLDAVQYTGKYMSEGFDTIRFLLLSSLIYLDEHPGDLKGAYDEMKDYYELIEEIERSPEAKELTEYYKDAREKDEPHYKAERSAIEVFLERHKEYNRDEVSILSGVVVKKSKPMFSMIIDAKR